jgi:hypothetical protein
MPHCDSCHVHVMPEKLFQDTKTNETLCEPCADSRPVVAVPETFLGRNLDYEFSYSKKEGIRASAKLGTASLSLHVPQQELVKLIGE